MGPEVPVPVLSPKLKKKKQVPAINCIRNKMNTVLPYIIAVIEGGVYLILVFTVFGPDLSDAIVIGIVIGLSLKMVANVLAVTGSCNEKRTQLSVSFICK